MATYNYNMRSGTLNNLSKWALSVTRLALNHGVEALREASTAPPVSSALIRRVTTPEGTFTIAQWQRGITSRPQQRFVYFLKTDQNGSLYFVGWRHSRTMGDANHEGVPGTRIDEILQRTNCAVPICKPNPVTIVAGTNDVVQGQQVTTAGDRLGKLVNEVLKSSH